MCICAYRVKCFAVFCIPQTLGIEIDSRHCMVGNWDHHEWHVTFRKHRMVGNLDHHGWYLHAIHVFHNFSRMDSQNKKCTKFALVATKSAQGTELRRGCCLRFWFAVLSCLCFF